MNGFCDNIRNSLRYCDIAHDCGNSGVQDFRNRSANAGLVRRGEGDGIALFGELLPATFGALCSSAARDSSISS